MLRCAYTTGCFVAVFAALVCSAAGEEPSSLLFSRDVLPILSENCFFCHGPDEEQRQAELRLDTHDGAAAVIYNTAAEPSKLLNRIRSDDPDQIMPPPDSNRHLTAAQKQTLEKWVSTGATWGNHWSFEPLTSPPVPLPAFDDVPVHNPIDAFVQRKLSEKKMRPSMEAEPHTLLRRISLDLTGLPPTVTEVADFIADDNPDRYADAVERLLNSPAFGERMAWDWLNAARYADTNGYQGDRERTMWPWRDWVVEAFNSNMPFDQFTTLQLAGDLLPQATSEQKLATGFCRNHMINGEGGRIAEENRVDYVMDMSETMGTVWLGLTLNCCRCHDHKYDPLTQNEYYQFFAFFNQTAVTGGGGDPQTAPVLPAASAEQQQQLAQIDQQLNVTKTAMAERVKLLEPQQTAWEETALAKRSLSEWKNLQPTSLQAQHQALSPLDDDSVLVGGDNAQNDTYTIEYPLSPGQLTGVRLEALQHESMTKGGLARSDSGNFVLTEIEFAMVRAEGATLLKINTAEATFEQGNLTITAAYDGNSQTGWAVYNGKPIDQSHAAVFRFAEPVDAQPGEHLRVVLRHDSAHAFHNLGRFRIAATAASQPQLASQNEDVLTALQVTPEKRSNDQAKMIHEHFLKLDGEYAKLLNARTSLTNQSTAINKATPKVMVMEDQAAWRPTFVLNRGLYNDITDREVTATTPVSLPEMLAAGDRGNRLDLARWLVADEHPLTARVTVNRIWQTFFGPGLVKTTEDFGVQAEYPEHKDLLDWLAADFRDNGWDVKRLIRTILMSHTYQQSSANREAVAPVDGQALRLSDVDPDNRLLARASRFRLPSWMLRDQALAISGLLNSRIGGPPVNTYQPAGVWEEATFGNKKYTQDSGENLYRRSLYIFWRRIIAPTMFFDNASRQSCTVKMLRTNTPLHALLTFNETAYVEAARTLAENLLTDPALPTIEDRIERAFLCTVGRRPSPQEASVLKDGLQRSTKEFQENATAAEELLTVGDSVSAPMLDRSTHAAWTSACLMLLNMDETLNRE
jgi:hypothetical protein